LGVVFNPKLKIENLKLPVWALPFIDTLKAQVLKSQGLFTFFSEALPWIRNNSYCSMPPGG
jgi:hypothetical protein